MLYIYTYLTIINISYKAINIYKQSTILRSTSVSFHILKCSSEAAKNSSKIFSQRLLVHQINDLRQAGGVLNFGLGFLRGDGGWTGGWG